MNSKTGWSQYSFSIRKYWLPLSLGILGLIFFTYGLISLVGSASKQPEVTFTKAGNNSENTNLITVDIEGAVIKPGVYRLSASSILQDLFVSCGGLSDDADREYVAKNINLASKLKDGAKIYIPKQGESQTPSQEALGEQVKDGLINVNTASSSDLDTLPGIGPVTSQKIIDNRPYSSINELLDKGVVSSKVFTQIKDRIATY